MPLIKVNSLYKKVEDNINNQEKMYGLLGLGKPKTSNVNKCDIFNDNSCIAYYPLDGNVNDMCGRYNGTWHGNAQYENGAAKFDGKSYIETNIKEYKSFSFFAKASNDSNRILVGARGISIRAVDGRIGFTTERWAGCGDLLGFALDKKLSEEFHFFYINTDPLEIYHNGVKQDLKHFYCSFPQNSYHFDKLTIAKGDFDTPFEGIIKKFRIFNRALTEDEIKILYNGKEIENLDLDIYYPEITGVDVDLSSTPLKITYNNLSEKHFDGDGKNYMVGNGNIKIETNCNKYDLEFITGSFATVDIDDGGTYHNDYIKITINNKDAILEVPSETIEKDNYRVKSNNTGYKIDLISLKYYDNQQLENQVTGSGSQIYKIKIYDLDTSEINISFHTNESFSNEAIGFQMKSAVAYCKETIQKPQNINNHNCNLNNVLHIILSNNNVEVKGL